MDDEDRVVVRFQLCEANNHEWVTVLPVSGFVVFRDSLYGPMYSHNSMVRVVEGIRNIDLYFLSGGYIACIVILKRCGNAIPQIISFQRRFRQKRMTDSKIPRQNLRVFCSGMGGLLNNDVIKVIIHAFYGVTHALARNMENAVSDV